MQKGIFTKFRLKGVGSTGWKRVGPGSTAPKDRKAWCRSAKRTMYRSLDRIDFDQSEH